MGWVDMSVGANSNMMEPLNYQNQMEDIAMYGANGYTMAPENKAIWQDMLAGSLSLYGYAAIREAVYRRLTDEDVDVLITKNGRLGQCLNAFYRTEDFVRGNITAVLSGLTPSTYNRLEEKLQRGINRYIGRRAAEPGLGEWLYAVSGVESIRTYGTLETLLEDAEYLESTAIPHESLWWVICLAAASYPAMSGAAGNVHASYLAMVAKSTPATLEFVEAAAGTGKLEEFFADTQVCETLAGSREAVWGIMSSAAGFQGMLDSTGMLNAVAAHEAGTHALMEGFQKASQLQPIVARLNSGAEAMADDISAITDDISIWDSVNRMKGLVSDCLTDLSGALAKATAFSNNLISCWSNKEFVMRTIGANQELAASIIGEGNTALGKAIADAVRNSGEFPVRSMTIINTNYSSGHNCIGHTILYSSYKTNQNQNDAFVMNTPKWISAGGSASINKNYLFYNFALEGPITNITISFYDLTTG